MSRQLKRRYRKAREEFRKDLYEACKENNALPIMLVNTYALWKNHQLIRDILYLSASDPYNEVLVKIKDTVFSRMLTGRYDIFHALYFSNRDIYEKYRKRIPQRFAMGDAVAVAYRVAGEKKD